MPAPPGPRTAAQHIKHIVFILEEKRSFDNIFGRFRADSAMDHDLALINLGLMMSRQPPPAPWRPAPDRILVPHTYTIDLARDEGALWAALRSKTRH